MNFLHSYSDNANLSGNFHKITAKTLADTQGFSTTGKPLMDKIVFLPQQCTTPTGCSTKTKALN